MSTTTTDFNPAACCTCGDLYDGNTDEGCLPKFVGLCAECAERVFVAQFLPDGADPDSATVGIANSAGAVLIKHEDEPVILTPEMQHTMLNRMQAMFRSGFAFGLQYHGGKRPTSLAELKVPNNKAIAAGDRMFMQTLGGLFETSPA